MNSRERFLRTIRFEKPDRVPIWEVVGFWPQTIDRWHKEGLPENIKGNWDPETEKYFGYDIRRLVPVNIQMSEPPIIERVLDEDKETKVVIDESGIKKRVFKNNMSMPQFLEYPVKNREDFEQWKTLYNPDSPERYPRNWDELVQIYSRREYVLACGNTGFYATLRNMLGVTNLSLMFYDNPQFIKDILSFWCDYLVCSFEQLLAQVDIDYIVLGEDMAYKNGPLISPAFFRYFILPHYQRVTKLLRAHGIEAIFIDSDGDIRELIPLFLEGGVTGVYPLEVQSGIDPVALRKKYGKSLIMCGGIEKMTLAQGTKAIEEEVKQKVPYLISQGGYIPSLDHCVPPNVSLKNYKFYLNLIREIVESPEVY